MHGRYPNISQYVPPVKYEKLVGHTMHGDSIDQSTVTKGWGLADIDRLIGKARNDLHRTRSRRNRTKLLMPWQYHMLNYELLHVLHTGCERFRSPGPHHWIGLAVGRGGHLGCGRSARVHTRVRKAGHRPPTNHNAVAV